MTEAMRYVGHPSDAQYSLYSIKRVEVYVWKLLRFLDT